MKIIVVGLIAAVIALGLAAGLQYNLNKELVAALQTHQSYIQQLADTNKIVVKLSNDYTNSIQDKLEERIGALESDVDGLKFILGHKGKK